MCIVGRWRPLDNGSPTMDTKIVCSPSKVKKIPTIKTTLSMSVLQSLCGENSSVLLTTFFAFRQRHYGRRPLGSHTRHAQGHGHDLDRSQDPSIKDDCRTPFARR